MQPAVGPRYQHHSIDNHINIKLQRVQNSNISCVWFTDINTAFSRSCCSWDAANFTCTAGEHPCEQYADQAFAVHTNQCHAAQLVNKERHHPVLHCRERLQTHACSAKRPQSRKYRTCQVLSDPHTNTLSRYSTYSSNVCSDFLHDQQLLACLKFTASKTAGHGVSIDVGVSLFALHSLLKQPQHSTQIALFAIHSNGSPGGKSGKNQP